MQMFSGTGVDHELAAAIAGLKAAQPHPITDSLPLALAEQVWSERPKAPASKDEKWTKSDQFMANLDLPELLKHYHDIQMKTSGLTRSYRELVDRAVYGLVLIVQERKKRAEPVLTEHRGES